MELPDKPGLAKIVERYARLLSSVGLEIGDRPLVLPNADFFPDRFTGDEASAALLVERMMSHAGMDDVPLTTRVVEEDAPEGPHGGCSSGCAVPGSVAGKVPRLVDTGHSWTLHVPSPELSHPVVLTTMAARALGHVFLVEALPSGVAPEAPADLSADYAAVALGFGPLLLEGAYVYSKSCGGPSIAQVTLASLPELAVVSALFVATGNHGTRAMLRELGATQRALFEEAHEWAQSNSRLVRLLKNDPARVAVGDYKLEEAKPWLLRLFGKKNERDDLDVVAKAPPVVRPPDPKRDELRALVDEALATSHAEAE